jgi:hypothetical protein
MKLSKTTIRTNIACATQSIGDLHVILEQLNNQNKTDAEKLAAVRSFAETWTEFYHQQIDDMNRMYTHLYSAEGVE